MSEYEGGEASNRTRDEAVLRVAKAELGMLLGWPDSIDEQWDRTPEELRARLMATGARAVDALGDFLGTAPNPETWGTGDAPVRIWDENHQLVHVFTAGEVSAEGDFRFSESAIVDPFTRWLLGQFEPCAYMTIDGPDGRWFGELGGFVLNTENGSRGLRVGWMPVDGKGSVSSAVTWSPATSVIVAAGGGGAGGNSVSGATSAFGPGGGVVGNIGRPGPGGGGGAGADPNPTPRDDDPDDGTGSAGVPA